MNTTEQASGASTGSSGGRRAKYQHAADQLRRRIMNGSLVEGAKLPSIQALSREFDLSPMTVNRAMRELAEEGLIHCNADRRGSVVARTRRLPDVSQTTLACLLRPLRPRNNTDNFGLDIVEAIRAETGRAKYRLLCHWLDEENVADRVVELVECRAVRGIIAHQGTPTSTLQRLADTGCPVVAFNRQEQTLPIGTVVPDYKQLAQDSIRLLLDHGFERVGFYCLPLDEWEWDEYQAARRAPLTYIRRAFVDTARELSLDQDRCLLMPEVMPHSDLNSLVAFGLPKSKPKDWMPLGIVSHSPRMAAALRTAVEKAEGYILGKDIGIIAAYDVATFQDERLAVSAWRTDTAELGSEVVRELLRRIDEQDHEPRMIRIPVEYIDRNTA